MAQALAEPRPPEVVRRVADLRKVLATWRHQGASLGLVPTMGALHDGHRALVRQARRDCTRVVATIFVNPTQFNSSDDLASYPRDEAADLAMLAEDGADLVFAPSVQEMYPDGFQTTVSLGPLTECLCGISRPGHLDGVATVVAKLLAQCLPDKAYFGEKDYQQLVVVRRMARDLDLPVSVEGVATVRAPDGLALSSRNQLLDREQRGRAVMIFGELQELAARLAGGAEAVPVLADSRTRLERSGFAPIDYLELRSDDTLELLDRADRPSRIFIAAWLGQVRLIDNLKVPGP